jgi:hypothetical protein
MYAAGVLGEVASDGGDDLTGGVRGVVVALVGDLLRDPDVYDARLDDHPLVRYIYLEDLAHPRHDYEHTRLDGERPAGEAGAGAAGDERDPLVVAGLDYSLDVLGGLRQDHEIRDNPVVHEAVALVGAELLPLGDHPLRTEDRLHRPYEPVSLHVCLLLGGPGPRRPSPSMMPRAPGQRPPRTLPLSTGSATPISFRNSILKPDQR